MENYNVKPDEWIDHKERFLVPKKNLTPQVDEVISKVVGHTVYLYDPRLTALIIKWKKGKSQDSMEPDNFLDDPAKVAELKEVFSKNI